MLPLYKISNDTSEVKPLSWVHYLVDKECVWLEPLPNKRLEEGNDVQRVESGIKLNKDIAEIEATDIADTLEEHFDVLAWRLFLFRIGMKGILQLPRVKGARLFLF